MKHGLYEAMTHEQGCHKASKTFIFMFILTVTFSNKTILWILT